MAVIRVLSAAVMLLQVMIACTAFAQAGDGYVGVFGDAAGTIQCMEAPPGVPTTLYVVGHLAGSTGSGVPGAEFRIEFSNPAGYILSYSAPVQATIVIGNPLDGIGVNLGFPSCLTPTAGTILLGTILVFNTGTGDHSDIIVKRRNPPLNANYDCALFTLCDSTFSLSCMTAPEDTSSCIFQKTAPLATTSDDEFATSLDGLAGSVAFEGVKLVVYPGKFFAISCKIDRVAPLHVTTAVHAFVGLDNNRGAQSGFKRSIEFGWTSQPDLYGTDTAYFVEEWAADLDIYKKQYYGSVSTPQTYAIKNVGENAVVYLNGVPFPIQPMNAKWSTYTGSAAAGFCSAHYAAEMTNSPDDYCPGRENNRNWYKEGSFSLAGNTCTSPFDGGVDCNIYFDGEDVGGGSDSADNGETVVPTTSSSSFSVYDTRTSKPEASSKRSPGPGLGSRHAMLGAPGTQRMELISGPPRSPVSWLPVQRKDSELGRPFAAVLGVSTPPDSITCVELSDEHPFGESERNVVWLARYDSLAVVSRSGGVVTLPLFAAFSVSTGALLAAFTVPTQAWIQQSTDEDWNIDAGWQMAPQRDAPKSSVLEVLALVLPGLKDAGQIILRPRYSGFTNLAGEQLPGDVWVVEVLGKLFSSRPGRPPSTRGAYLFRDGTLEFVRLGFAP